MVRTAVAVVLLVLAACTDPEPQPDSIVFAIAAAPGMLDPRLASDAASERINALLFDRLVLLDELGIPQPKMARWEQLTPMHYRLVLQRDRASFWDGRLPNAHDVVATYRGLLDPQLASPHAGGLAHVAGISALDDETVDFRLARADPLFPSRLTVGILPAALAIAPRAVDRPKGSGRFEFLSRESHGGLVLRRRSDGLLIVFEPVSDPTMRVLKLLRGEANLLQNDLPPEMVDYLDQQTQVQLQTGLGTTFAYLGFNLLDPVLARHEVRAAIAHAIDRKAIIRYLFGGRAQEAGSILRPRHWAGAADLNGFTFDADRARGLLKQAGFSAQDPLQLEYKTSTDPLRLRIAHVLQQQFADVGIDLKISSYDWGTFFGDIKAGRFQLYSLAWVGVNSPEILRYAFHGDSLPPAGANRGRYRSEVVDRLIETAETLPMQQAKAVLLDIQNRIHDDIVYVPLWYESNVAASRGVTGYVPGYDGNYLALEKVMKTDAH